MEILNKDRTERASATFRGWSGDVLQALSFLTRLPMSRFMGAASAPSEQVLRAHPIAGAMIGAMGGVVLMVAAYLGLPDLLAATLCIAALVAITGAFHEDALADTMDGFGGGWTHEEKLEIMRDSRLGSYGAAAMFLVLAVRIAAVYGLLSASAGACLAVAALVAAGALSRAFSVSLLSMLAPARTDGLSATAGRPSGSVITQAVVVGLALSLAAVWLASGLFAALTAAGASAIALWLVKRLAHAQIGGQTGDVAGACQQICECTFLVALVAAT